jgi:hypothetical protein
MSIHFQTAIDRHYEIELLAIANESNKTSRPFRLDTMIRGLEETATQTLRGFLS